VGPREGLARKHKEKKFFKEATVKSDSGCCLEPPSLDDT
jgi:hypothetical protein